jgi:hypothetical protein
MAAPLRERFTSWWQQVPAAIADFPILTAGEQTKLSWARRIEGREEVPAHFLDVVDELIDQTGGLPYLVLTPSYAAFLSRTTEKLLCCIEDEIRIYERVNDSTRLIAFRYADVSAVEVGCVLLKSWIKLIGRTSEGVETTLTVKFNTVTDYLFAPIIQRLRGDQGAGETEGIPVSINLALAAEQAKFNHLAHDHYKFMNVAKKSILPGEQVIGSVMQPELRTPFVTLFGHTLTRLKAPAHIVVRTDRELIIAVEENQEAWSGSHKYGSIRTYVPLSKIESITCVDEPGGDTLHLVIELNGGHLIELDFAKAEAEAVRAIAMAPGG